MSDKEVFKNAVISAIKSTVRQGKRSLNSGGECAYRGCNGLRCTLGHMIDYTHYTGAIESTDTDNPLVILSVINSLGIGALSEKRKGILSALQSVHDLSGSYVDFVGLYSSNLKDKVKSGMLPQWTLEGLTNQKAQ